MTQENEKLRALCVAQEAEIARLQSGFDDLKAWVLDNEYQEILYKGNMSEYLVISEYLLEEINRITGEGDDH